jgi:hypothetical protein
MSGLRSFRSIVMVASCAGAALGCYLVSLRVASERAALEDVETRIVLQQRELRVLQTEIGTRGRLSQLERWNAGAFALSAPSADQFLHGGFELARLAQPDRKVDFQEPVVLASAQAPQRQLVTAEPESDDAAGPIAQPPTQLLHQASLKTETREVPARTTEAEARPAVPKSTDRPAAAAKPAISRSADKPGLAAAQSRAPSPTVRALGKPAVTAGQMSAKKTVDKVASLAPKPVTKSVRLAKTDPLAPLAIRQPTKHRDSTAAR